MTERAKEWVAGVASITIAATGLTALFATILFALVIIGRASEVILRFGGLLL